MKKTLITLALPFLTACGGTYNITRTVATVPKHVEAVALSPRDGNSQEVDGYVSSALVQQGLVVKMPLPAKAQKDLDVDVIVSYQDRWGWDLATILSAITINMYDASSGALLVTGEWERSVFHDYERGKNVSQKLVQRMLQAIRATGSESKK